MRIVIRRGQVQSGVQSNDGTFHAQEPLRSSKSGAWLCVSCLGLQVAERGRAGLPLLGVMSAEEICHGWSTASTAHRHAPLAVPYVPYVLRTAQSTLRLRTRTYGTIELASQ